jgi:hypothetical protein
VSDAKISSSPNEIQGGSNTATFNTATFKMLHQIFEGVSRPLKVRVQQVLTGQSDLVLSYKLTHLLDFYAQMLGEVLSPSAKGATEVKEGGEAGEGGGVSVKSSVAESIEECKEAAAQSFDRLLVSQGERLHSAPAPYPSDLAPSSITVEQTNRLVELLAVFDSSLLRASTATDDGDTSSGSTKTVGSVIKVVLTPVFATVDRSAAEHDLDQSNSAILQINNRLHVQKALGPFAAAATTASEIGVEINSWLDVLVMEQVGVLLARCGVLQVLQVLDKKEAGVAFSTMSGSEEQSMTAVFKDLYATLFDLSIPHFDRLIQPTTREYLLSINRFASFFLFEMLFRPALACSNHLLMILLRDCLFPRHAGTQDCLLYP